MSVGVPLSSIYLSPRVVREAEAAGVSAIGINPQHMRGIRDIVAEHEPARGPTDPLDELTFVMRWGGRLGLSADVCYSGAAPDQTYLSAETFGVQTEPVRTSREQLQKSGRQVVELAIQDWQTPDFGQRLAKALLDYGNYASGLPTTLLLLLATSGTARETRKLAIANLCQQRFPHPLSVMILPRLTARGRAPWLRGGLLRP